MINILFTFFTVFSLVASRANTNVFLLSIPHVARPVVKARFLSAKILIERKHIVHKTLPSSFLRKTYK